MPNEQTPDFRTGFLARNYLLNFAGYALPLVVGLVTLPFIIRWLGTDRFGILSLVWVVIGYFSMMDLGLGRATIRFIADALGRGDERQVPLFLWTTVVFQGIIGLLGAFVLWAGTPVLVDGILRIPEAFRTETAETFRILAVSLPVIMVSASFRGVLEARQRFDLVNAVKIPAGMTNYLLPLVALLLRWHLPGIVALLLVSRTLTLAAWIALSVRVEPSIRKVTFRAKTLKPLLAFGGWATVSNVVGPLLEYLDRFMIGSTLTLKDVSFYTAPYEAVSRLGIIHSSLMITLFPMFSSLHGGMAFDRIRDLYGRAFKFIFLAVGSIAAGLVVAARPLLRLWLGAPFAERSAFILQAMAVGFLFLSLGFIAFTLLQGIGRADIPAKLQILELIVYVPLLWAFIRAAGIRGAVIAWALRLFIDLILLTMAAGRRLGFRPASLLGRGIGAAALLLALFVAAGTAIPKNGLWPLSILPLGLFMAAGLWGFALDPDERRLIRGVLRPGNRKPSGSGPGSAPDGKKRVAVSFPLMSPGGGSEAVALWALEALKTDYAVRLITFGPVDFEEMNRSYGTNLRPDEADCDCLPLGRLARSKFDALRGFRLARHCRSVAPGYDVMFHAYNVMDFGRPGIQYISDFTFDDRLRREFVPARTLGRRLLHGSSPWRFLYLKIPERLAGVDRSRWRSNLTLANSRWTRDMLRRHFGIESRVVHPPVVVPEARRPWERREAGVLTIGRLVPEKGADAALGIVARLREAGHDLHWHHLGGGGDRRFAESLRASCARKAEWARCEGLALGEAKWRLVGGHRYGLSACRHESFGLAVAEMVKMGCLVWVPNGGGQVEIVDHPDLIYETEEDAVRKMDRVLRSPDLEIELRDHLARRAEHFSPERFIFEIRSAVEGFLDGRPTP